MIRSTWESRELPILETIGRAEVDGRYVDLSIIAGELGADRQAVERGVEALADANYITGIDATTFDGYDLINIRLLERGRRSIGQWPAEDPFASLVDYLKSRVEQETDPEKKSRLEQLLSAVGNMGRDLATSVLTAWVRQQLGL